MDIEKLEELIQLLESSDISEIEIEEGGRRIHLKKSVPVAPPPPAIPISVAAAQPMEVPAVVQGPEAAAGAAAQPAAGAEPSDDGLLTFDSPMVGVFYLAPSPGEPTFVAVGDTVEKGQTVCIVEAMKLMNEVPAKFRGEIVQILVENAEPVEFGQALFKVRPR